MLHDTNDPGQSEDLSSQHLQGWGHTVSSVNLKCADLSCKQYCTSYHFLDQCVTISFCRDGFMPGVANQEGHLNIQWVETFVGL